MDSEEYWDRIKGYDYFVSTHGKIENAKTGTLLKPFINSKGYYAVKLCKNGKTKTFRVHRLVAEAFIENPKNKLNVDHIDGNRTNNHINNLRFATHTENNRNASIRSNNTSGIKGVSWHKSRKKWRARISINGKDTHIGQFKSIEDAKKARQEFANEFYGDFMNQCEKV